MKRFLTGFVIATLAFTIVHLPLTASAADFEYEVNSLDDNDDSTCDGVHCSLREAIDAANNDAGTSEITFSVSGTITITSGIEVISEPVDIVGPGSGDITIDFDSNGLFRIEADSDTTNISGLTVLNGTPSFFITSSATPVTLDDIVSDIVLMHNGGHTIENGSFTRIWNDEAEGQTTNNITIFNNTITSYLQLKGDNIEIANNTFTNAGGAPNGSSVINPSGAMTNSTIGNNTLQNGSALWIDQMDTVEITGNTFNNNAGLQSGWGGTANNLTISGNTFTCDADTTIFYIQGGDPGTGIVFDDSSGTGNTITNCGANSVAVSADDALIKGNTFDNSGLRILRGGASAEELFVIEDNTFAPLGDFHAIDGSFNDPLQYVDIIGNTFDCTGSEDAKAMNITNSNISYFNFGDALVEAEGNTSIDCECYGGAFYFDGTNVTVGYNDFGNYGIGTGDTMENSTFVHNTSNGMSFRMDSNNTVSDNTVSTWVGIWMQGVGNTISNNNITIGAGGNGIIMTADGDISGGTNTISNNTITATTGGSGIVITGNDTGSIQDLVIDGNILTGPLDPVGMSIINMNEDGESSDITIQNNQISGGLSFGTLIQNYVGALTIDGNTIEDSGWDGLYIDDDVEFAEGTVVSNNTFSGNAKGLHTAAATGLTASGNTYTNNTTTGIEVRSSDNTFTNETITGGAYGVSFAGEANDSENNTITDSSISGTSTADLYSYNVGPGTTGTNTINNTSFSDYEVTDGILDINYRARVNAKYGATNIVASTISAIAADNNVTALGVSDDSGLTGYTLLDAYQVSGAGVINNKNPYSFQGSKTGYTTTSTSASLTTPDQTVTLNLTVPSSGNTTGGYVIKTPGIEEPPTIEPPEETPSGPSEPATPSITTEEEEAINEAAATVINSISNTVSGTPPSTGTTPNEQPGTTEQPISENTISEIISEYTPPTPTENPNTILAALTGESEDTTAITNQISETFNEAIAGTSGPVTIVDPFQNEEIEITDPANTVFLPESLYTEEELSEAIKTAQNNGQTAVVVTTSSDYDQDLVSDLYSINYGIPLFDPDSDNDGFSNAEEVFMGTNPTTANEISATPQITNLDGATVGSTPSFRIVSTAGDTVEIVLVEATPNNEIEYVSVGSTQIDSRNKGEITTPYPLKDAQYYAIPKGQNGYGPAIRFTVDSKLKLITPKFESKELISKSANLRLTLGYYTGLVVDYWDTASEEFDSEKYIAQIAGDALVIRGNSAPNSINFIAFKSVLLSSVVLSDANGNFEAIVYAEGLDLQTDHAIIGYSQNYQGNQISSAAQTFISRLK